VEDNWKTRYTSVEDKNVVTENFMHENQDVSHEYWTSKANIALQPSDFAKKEAITREMEERGEITYQLFTNDGQSDSVIALTTLKNIFARQLPKMPKDYIVRLVFDRRHYSLAIIRQGVIIGGICYRPYFPQRFAEIAFCAVNSTEQVRGFGTIMMNNLKSRVQKQSHSFPSSLMTYLSHPFPPLFFGSSLDIEYFLTFADNYAIGYFQKQGFTKTINLPKDRFV
jgi:histone acetyltransferase